MPDVQTNKKKTGCRGRTKLGKACRGSRIDLKTHVRKQPRGFCARSATAKRLDSIAQGRGAHPGKAAPTSFSTPKGNAVKDFGLFRF